MRRVQLKSSEKVNRKFTVAVDNAGVAIPNQVKPIVDQSTEEWINEDKLYKEWLIQGV